MTLVNVTEEELFSFIKSLEAKLRVEDANIRRSAHGQTWDTVARHTIGERMRDWFKEFFGLRTLGIGWENCFGYEGQKRNIARRAIKRAEIFSSISCYPDMYFVKPPKIALELDHGNKGSALKNALTKAGFDRLSGDWGKVLVIFFDESDNKQIKESLKDEGSKKVLEFYRKQLNTEVIMI